MTKKTITADIAKDSQKAIIALPWTVNLHPLADAELKAVPLDMQARFVHIAELLEELGPQRVGLPHIRPLEGKLWDVNIRWNNQVTQRNVSCISTDYKKAVWI